jgi:SOS-response transcriptional repressor LexA
MLTGLKPVRLAAKMNQRSAARGIGVPFGTYNNWERCANTPPTPMVVKIADFFNVPIDELVGRLPESKSANGMSWRALGYRNSPTVRFPVFDSVAYGQTLVYKEAARFIEASVTWLQDYPNSYFLKVPDDSMNRRLLCGHFALVSPSSKYTNGDLVAVCIGGDDAVIRIYHKMVSTEIFSPDSVTKGYKDIVADLTRRQATLPRVLGKVVWACYPEEGIQVVEDERVKEPQRIMEKKRGKPQLADEAEA